MTATPLQNSTGAQHARILGVGAYRPSRVVTNEEVCQYIESTDEWIRARSGIIERRFAEPHETVQSMSVASARTALEAADIHPQQIGCIVVATVSHLLQTPAVATMIADELGATPAAAFDISAACAGFCHGVALASDMIRAGTAKYVLAIGVERLSDITDRTDRSTAFIFADGAGAAVIGPAEENGIGPVVWGSDGEKHSLITQKESWIDVLGSEVPAMPHLKMEGNPVFRWASYEMAKVAREALDRAGITVEELDAFIPHQANMRITDAMARALKLPEHVAVARDVAYQGNTSAASVPLAMDRMIRDGEVKSGDTALLIAFGAGLAYAAQVVTIP
ncbi:MAG: ketoacyl-ACP synthase III [Actinomycetota bacterium]|nr:ketoacyl-ACP synthase III [Actinomycetota bacterium]